MLWKLNRICSFFSSVALDNWMHSHCERCITNRVECIWLHQNLNAKVTSKGIRKLNNNWTFLSVRQLVPSAHLTRHINLPLVNVLVPKWASNMKRKIAYQTGSKRMEIRMPNRLHPSEMANKNVWLNAHIRFDILQSYDNASSADATQLHQIASHFSIDHFSTEETMCLWCLLCVFRDGCDVCVCMWFLLPPPCLSDLTRS